MFWGVYGLKDFEPFAVACKACASLVCKRLEAGYAVPAIDAPKGASCELFYEGVCIDKGENQ